MPFSQYNANWSDDYKDCPLRLELRCIQKGGEWKNNKGEICGLGLFEHMMKARALLWPKRYRHDWTDLLYHNFIDNDITILMGCACVAGHTKLLDPTTGKLTPVSEFYENGVRPVVMTLDGPELAGVPFIKGISKLIEITLSTGRKFTVAPEHRVLTEGGFVRAVSLRVGRRLVAYDESLRESNSGKVQSLSLEGVSRWWKTTPDYWDDCLSGFRPYDEQPLHASNIVQESFPSQDGVRTLNARVLTCLGVSGQEPEHNRPSLSFSHPSSCSALSPACNKETSDESHSFSETERYGGGGSLSSDQSPQVMRLRSPFLERVFDSSHIGMDYEMPWPKYRVELAHITSIKIKKSEVFFDLEVPKSHHYFAEGAIHHNSSQKTSHAVEYVLLRYCSSPENTLAILSTVNMDKLDIGVYAELIMLWDTARKLHPWLPGHSVGYKRAITTDDIDEVDVRLFTKGIIARPCYVGGRNVGLGVLAGVKQENIIYVCDELQFMADTFAMSWPHLFSNGNVKIIGSGNPKHDPEDQLSIAAEPREGWASHVEPIKTEVWPTKFMGGKCVNLVGTDSPNFKVPEGQPEPFKKLIGRKFEQRMAHDHGRDSFEYYRLVKGVMKIGYAQSRVITRQLCREFHAMDSVIWKDNNQTKGYSLDPSYGGEDRCVGMPWRFGEDIDGRQILLFMPYRVFPISLQSPLSVEDQIAATCEEELNTHDIPPENLFYDACGKGTIGAALARRFGKRVPIAVDSGARCTKRPVREGLYVDDENGQSRLKRCDEHYSKFVTEMWFSWRYAIEADQLRGLAEDTMAEGCARIYYVVAGNKIEVEPKNDPKKKEDLKRRLGKSPDLADVAAIAVEGARQRGFIIGRLGDEVADKDVDDDFFEKEAKEYAEAIKSKLLVRT